MEVHEPAWRRSGQALTVLAAVLLILPAALPGTSLAAAAEGTPPSPGVPDDFFAPKRPLIANKVLWDYTPMNLKLQRDMQSGLLLMASISTHNAGENKLTVDPTPVATPARGTVALFPDGAWEYTPEYTPGANNFYGVVEFKYKVWLGPTSLDLWDVGTVKIVVALAGLDAWRPLLALTTSWRTPINTAGMAPERRLWDTASKFRSMLWGDNVPADLTSLTFSLVAGPADTIKGLGGRVGPHFGKLASWDASTGDFEYTPDDTFGLNNVVQEWLKRDVFFVAVSTGNRTATRLLEVQIGVNATAGPNYTCAAYRSYEVYKTKPIEFGADTGLLAGLADLTDRELLWNPGLHSFESVEGTKFELSPDGAFKYTPPDLSWLHLEGSFSVYLLRRGDRTTAPMICMWLIHVDEANPPVLPMPPVDVGNFNLSGASNGTLPPPPPTNGISSAFAAAAAAKGRVAANKKKGRAYDASFLAGVLRTLRGDTISADNGITLAFNPDGAKQCLARITKKALDAMAAAGTKGLACKPCDRCLRNVAPGTAVSLQARANKGTIKGRRFKDSLWSPAQPLRFTL